VVPVTALAFHPDGQTLVSGGYKQVLVWDLGNGKLARKIGKLSGQVRALAFDKDGRTLAVAEGVPGRSGAVTLLDFESGAATTLAQTKDEMLAVAFHPEGKLLAAGGTDAVVRVWNLADQQPPTSLKEHSDWISGVAFSPDGKLLATGSADKTVRIWDTATWKVRIQLPQTLTDVVNGVEFAPEGDFLAYAVGGPDERAIRIWQARNAFVEVDASRPAQRNTIVQTRPLDMGTCLPLGVAWLKQPAGAPANAHSRLVMACADKTVKVVGPGGNVFNMLTGHTDWVYAVAASPDGLRFASGSGDGTVKVWGAAGKLLATLTEEAQQ
jgi:WD40 repeat protein